MGVPGMYTVMMPLFALSVFLVLVTRGYGPKPTRAVKRMLRIVFLLLLVSNALSAPVNRGNNIGMHVSAAALEHIDFAKPENQIAAKAELDHLKSQPFAPKQLAGQFAHGIDSMLPHGQRTTPATDEYWVDPDTKLVHHIQIATAFRGTVPDAC